MASPFRPGARGLVVLAALAWAYWPTARDLWAKWSSDPQYSHGMLVPAFAAFLLYRNRGKFAPSRGWPVLGAATLLVALAVRAAGAWTAVLTLDGLSLVVALAGLTVLAGGRGFLRAAWPSLVFLLFMVPLPYTAERLLGAQLQQVATVASTFLLQCCGLPALSEGNLILIEEVRLGVVEACSGLRMLVTFGAFCVGAVFVMDRAWVVKGLVLLSTAPIALVTNIGRITLTGLAHVWLKDSPHKTGVLDFIHDFNGWMMMPVGLGFLLFELWVFKYLLIEPAKKAAAPAPAAYVPQSLQAAEPGARKPVRVRVKSAAAPVPAPLPAPPPVARPAAPAPVGRDAFVWRG